MGDIIDRIRAQHTMMVRLLGKVEKQVEKFERGENPDLHLMGDMIQFLVTHPDQCHHPLEDLLYDTLVRKVPESAGAIKDIRQEHETMARQLRNLSQAMTSIIMEVEVSRDTFSAMASNFIARQLHHIANEETGLLKLARETLSAQDLQELQERARNSLPGQASCENLEPYAHFLDLPGKAA